MALTISSTDSIVKKDGIPVLFPKDSLYGPTSIIAGFDTAENLVLGKFTTDGRLKVDTSVTIDSIDMGDVNVLLKVGGIDKYLNGVLNPDTTTHSALVQDPRQSYTGTNLNADVKASALPSGAATQATLATLLLDATFTGRLGEVQVAPTANTVLGRLKDIHDRLDVALSTRATETTLATLLLDATFTGRLGEVSATPTANTVLGRLKNIDDGQTDASQKTQIVDGAGAVIGSTSNALDVNVKSGVTLEVNLDNANDDVLAYGNDGATNRALKTDAAGELQIDVLSSATPNGSANSYYQDQSGTALTGSFAQQLFGFSSFNISLANDSALTDINFSFDGVNTHGTIKPAEIFVMDYRRQTGIYLKGAGAEYRVMAY